MTINDNPNNIFSLNMASSRRRLLGNGYQIIAVDSKTFKIVLDDSTSANSYTVNINKP